MKTSRALKMAKSIFCFMWKFQIWPNYYITFPVWIRNETAYLAIWDACWIIDPWCKTLTLLICFPSLPKSNTWKNREKKKINKKRDAVHPGNKNKKQWTVYSMYTKCL